MFSSLSHPNKNVATRLNVFHSLSLVFPGRFLFPSSSPLINISSCGYHKVISFLASISPSFFFQYNVIEHAHVQLTFTNNNLQQNDNYNLKLKKKSIFLGFFTQLHKLHSLRRSCLHFHFISAVHRWFISYIINKRMLIRS